MFVCIYVAIYLGRGTMGVVMRMSEFFLDPPLLELPQILKVVNLMIDQISVLPFLSRVFEKLVLTSFTSI